MTTVRRSWRNDLPLYLLLAGLAVAGALVLLALPDRSREYATASVYAAVFDDAGAGPHLIVTERVRLPAADAEEAFRRFVDHLGISGGLPGPLRVTGLEVESGELVAMVELVSTSPILSNDGWYQGFQGSAGARATELAVRWNLLQPGFAGRWPQTARLAYRGRPIEPFDHLDLSGDLRRTDVPKP